MYMNIRISILLNNIQYEQVEALLSPVCVESGVHESLSKKWRDNSGKVPVNL